MTTEDRRKKVDKWFEQMQKRAQEKIKVEKAYPEDFRKSEMKGGELNVRD
jgi:hypothetical protein